MNDPLRIAVVGVGEFGVLHAEALSRLPEARLVALVDPDTTRAQVVAARFGSVAVFSNLGDLIVSNAAEAVVIATRADSHVALAAQAVKGGLHVLVEKPLANQSEKIREFQSQLGSNREVVMIDHLCLFHSLVIPLVERVRTSSFRALHFVRHRPECVGARFPDDHPIQLTMIHDLYIAAQMAQGEEPISFQAMDSRGPAGRVDMSWVTLRWNDGRIATFQCHMMLPGGSPAEGWDSIEIFGDGLHSRVTTNPAPWSWTDTQTRWPVNLEIHEGGGMLAGLLKNFVAACRGLPIARGCRVEDALQVQVWVEKLIASAKAP